ncbi:short chain dehydrogenase reductase [Hypoxylon rubiginosum]|uniref:Short chain dehydrogenase reductase n=1 Tax=Hypoxylon rubiginosum TaxID=110542 RepID=A0ACB9YU95_9PEZI|nr:short chain dehydrogenase reductase [Hypoxylon rubiginosum]
MTALKLNLSDIPDLTGQIAIITGGCSGIGLAAGRILASRNASVHALDISPPHPEDGENPPNWQSHIVDVSDWNQLSAAFKKIGRIDIAIANAGISEDFDFFSNIAGPDDAEPQYRCIDVNLRAVINFVHLALSAFRKYDRGGSIVITASATGYSPEHSLPVYSAAKAGVLGLIRALRPSLPYTHNVVINGVAPAATITRLLPKNLAAPIVAAGSPVSTAEHVGLAVAWSAVGTEERQVDRYGRDPDEVLTRWPGRWNGRIILTLGDTWTEVEGPLADRKAEWLGEWQAKSTANQQVLTDMRPLPNPHSNN